MKTLLPIVAGITAACISSGFAQKLPGTPEENGLTPKTDTIYVNVPDLDNPDLIINNSKTESLGVAIAGNGNVLVGWEDDNDGLRDLEAVWTLYNSSGVSITPATTITTLNPEFAGETLTSKLLSYFRKDGSAVSGRTSWGPKIKANPFGNGIGMGATSFELGIEVTELAGFNETGDFPAVQLLENDGKPIGIVTGVPAEYAAREGDIRIADWDYLSNGNIVIVGESRQNQDLVDVYGGASPDKQVIYRIVDSTGKEVRAVGAVSATPDTGQEIWHGVGVTKDGFAVRWNKGVRLFNNAGDPLTTTNIDLASLTGKPSAAGGGRGDGVGFHGNGVDAYALANSGTDDQGNPAVWLTVLNADGTLRYSRSVADDLTLTKIGRVDCAIDASGRVIVVFDDTSATGGAAPLVMGRLFDPTGKPLGGTFYVSEKELPDPGTLDANQPRVAWRSDFVVIVWQSKNSPDLLGTKVVAMRQFSTFTPGSVESVGLTRIVPDTPIINQEMNALGNWEPYISVLGTSTFLLEGNAFAEGSTDTQRFVVMFQPVDGKPGKLGEGFYTDAGQPFRGQINLSRQNGNPGRVAGDKRPGAVNFIVGAEASPHSLPEFQSDNRWNLGFLRANDARFATVQIYSLDPVTLEQKPLTKALDAINGRLTSGDASTISQLGRFGGEVACLDNGNFVITVDDRSQVRDPANSTTAVIMAPDGSIVKDSWLVQNLDPWSNLAAYKGGFCARVHQYLHFCDNAGNEIKVVDQATSGESFDTGRGDGTRIGAHINSPYVFLAGKVTTGNMVRIAAWDSRDQSFVAVAEVSEPAFPGTADRVNLAVDALNRITVAWVSQPPGYEKQQVAARVLALNETNKTIVPLTKSFFPFINASPTNGIRSLQMSVAMTTKQICIAAKGEINLQNKPQEGANSPTELNFYTVFSHPDPKDDPTTPVGGLVQPKLTIARAGDNVTITWDAPGFVLQSSPAVTGAPWTKVQTTGNTYTTAISGSALFFRLSSQ
jgi:hypothetical protein